MVHTHAIGDADNRILQAVYRYQYLKPEQILRLLYSAGSKTYVREHLSNLTEQNMLIRTYLYRASSAGSSPAIYSMGPTGLRILRREDKSVPARARRSEVVKRSPEYLQHVLAVNDFLISVALLCKDTPGYRIAQLAHERDLKRNPMKMRLPNWEGVYFDYTLSSDSWIDLHAGNDRYCMLLELDRCTEERKAWQQKVRAIVASMEFAYPKMFGTDILTVAVIVVKNPNAGITPQARMENLLKWTEQALDKERQQDKAELFCFYADDITGVEPITLFHDPVWYQPFSNTPVSLLT